MIIDCSLPHSVTFWISQYGSVALFVLLALGIFALPVPDETLLVLAGTLIAHGKLSLITTCIASFAGACCGITISYVIGRTAGIFLIQKYGYLFRITTAHLQLVQRWFKSIGRWTLCVGYFIPGVRHVSGYAAGVAILEYRQFALFSYSGAGIWTAIFVALGYFMGNKWQHVMKYLDKEDLMVIIIATLVILFGLCILYIYKRLRR